jgi:uncharacterized membrane protein
MKVLWIIAVILVIIDAVYLLSYMGRLMKLLEDIRKDTRELIIKARRAEDEES